jgi:hypothetical protein
MQKNQVRRATGAPDFVLEKPYDRPALLKSPEFQALIDLRG